MRLNALAPRPVRKPVTCRRADDSTGTSSGAKRVLAPRTTPGGPHFSDNAVYLDLHGVFQPLSERNVVFGSVTHPSIGTYIGHSLKITLAVLLASVSNQVWAIFGLDGISPSPVGGR